jgi:hypothetical protein
VTSSSADVGYRAMVASRSAFLSTHFYGNHGELRHFGRIPHPKKARRERDPLRHLR